MFSGAKIIILYTSLVDTITADALAPCVATHLQACINYTA